MLVVSRRPDRRSSHATLAVVAIALMLSSCATPVEPAASGNSPETSDVRDDARTPTPMPSDLVAEEPSAEVEEEIADTTAAADGSPSPLPRIQWPDVAVPDAPEPRLAITCDELLSASGATDASSAPIPPTAQTIGVRQGGGTVCAFAVDTPGGAVDALLMLAAEVDSPTTTAVACAPNGWKSDTVSCAGSATSVQGTAAIEYEMPAGSDVRWGTSSTQAILDAATDYLDTRPALGPVPTAHPDSMGAEQKYCDPSPEQQSAVFGLFPDGETDIYGGAPGTTYVDSTLHGRVGTLSCVWWLGWQGITIEVVPGAGWIADELDGTAVEVDGAAAAIRTERSVLEYRSTQQWLMPEIAIVASVRGSAIIVRAVVDETLEQYFDEKLPLVAAAIIATQP